LIAIDEITKHVFFNGEHMEPCQNFFPRSANARVARDEVTSVLDLS
jgi:hypothetical protein